MTKVVHDLGHVFVSAENGEKHLQGSIEAGISDTLVDQRYRDRDSDRLVKVKVTVEIEDAS